MANLIVKIIGDASSLNKAMSKAKSSMAVFAKVMSGALAGATAVFAGGVAVFSKLKALVDPVATDLDNIAKAAKRIGIGVEDFEQLGFAARRTGVQTSTVEKAFKRMQKTIGDSGRGLSTARDALAALGLSFEQLDGKMPMDQFDIVARRLAAIEDVTKRNAIAQDVFGARAGLAVAPLISEYSNLSSELRMMNGLMGEDAAAAAEKYKDELEDLEVVLKSIVAASGAIGAMAEAVQALEASITGLRRSIPTLREVGDLAGSVGLGILGGGVGASIGLVGSSARTFGARGGAELGARKIFKGLRETINKIGKGVTTKGAQDIEETASPALRAISTGIIGGGGTLASLGGDISGGGFSARMSISQEQLAVLKEIREAALTQNELYSAGASNVVTNRWIEEINNTLGG